MQSDEDTFGPLRRMSSGPLAASYPTTVLSIAEHRMLLLVHPCALIAALCPKCHCFLILTWSPELLVLQVNPAAALCT